LKGEKEGNNWEGFVQDEKAFPKREKEYPGAGGGGGKGHRAQERGGRVGGQDTLGGELVSTSGGVGRGIF